MTITIEIDNEVQQALATRASKEGFNLFSPNTPNQVLRILLGVDTPPILQAVSQLNPERPPTPSSSIAGTNVSSPASGHSHKRIGPRLLREHRLNCEKGYYSDTGIPYQKPAQFPAVFFDPNGYLIVRDESSMHSNPHINVGKQVSIPGGISRIPGYVKCGHIHS